MVVPGHDHDVFLSYSHHDQDWVRAFKDEFTKEFQRREGRPVTIWQDINNIRPASKWNNELENAIRNAAVFFAVISQSYQYSDWCARERSLFLEHHRGLDGIRVEHLYRFLKVVLLPARYPVLDEIANAAEFFERQTERLFQSNSIEFTVAITGLVKAVRELFRLMSNRCLHVFLASSAFEMSREREQLQGQLKAAGYQVHPGFQLDDQSFSLEVLVKEMEPCSTGIFLLGGKHYDFVETQLSQATQTGKPCIFWVQPRLYRSADKAQRHFVEEIQTRQDLPNESEVLGGQSISALWVQLSAKLKRIAAIETGTAGAAHASG